MLAAAALTLVLGCTASWAAEPVQSNDLGKAWPNAPDVSRSPHWHVYVFQRNGVRYVQVNDLNGNVRGAFGTANGTYLVLPIGSDSSRVLTPTQGSVPANVGETVYQDSQVTLSVATDPTTGAAALLATCTDPDECAAHVQSQSGTDSP
jgi:hypothetical protein